MTGCDLVQSARQHVCLSPRHHTNPVGTEWRWKMDQPDVILKEAIENHQNMIKQFKGIYIFSIQRNTDNLN